MNENHFSCSTNLRASRLRTIASLATVATSLLISGLPLVSSALTLDEAEQIAKRAVEDPKSFMLSDPAGGVDAPAAGPLVDPELLAAKNQVRDQIDVNPIPSEHFIGGPIKALEKFIDPAELVDTRGRILLNPREIDYLGYMKAKARGDAWSSPIFHRYRGHTAVRYVERPARRASNWLEAWNFASAPGRTYFDLATSNSPTVIERLSPAEKYDMLISSPREHTKGIFSRSEWQKGARSQEELGKVPTWYGYCHGWAPASYMVKRPTNAVDVPSFDGTRRIRFFPSDIKALAIALWANAKPRARFIGTRCEEANPSRDSYNRVLNSSCFDVNPGIFHLALVNQLGVAKRNLVIDATYDTQVWNQPILSYNYSYFNVQNGQATDIFRVGSIPLRSYYNDPFRRYRSPQATQVIGVVLEIEYGLSNVATHVSPDSRSNDRKRTAKYVYDLELNDRDEVIGGEWRQLKHPDFVWAHPKGTRAMSAFEQNALGDWNPRQSLPAAWAAAAQKAGTRGQPLGKIVEALVSFSNGGPALQDPQ